MAKSGSETTWGHRLARLVGFLFMIAASIRALLFFVYVGLMVPIGYEVHALEAKMVHLAWRVQHGVRLYPPWHDGPFVANFFGPVYFGLVGFLGRWMGSSLADLFYVGRAVTLSSILITFAITVGMAGRRSGRTAGVFAGLLVLGAAPFYGFGVMTRPDVFACWLGLAGFLLATSYSRPKAIAGAVVLAAAILAKQTAALYFAGAVLALLADRRWRPALAIGLGVGLGVAALVGGVTLLYEPQFGPDLLAERLAPWDLAAYHVLLWRVLIIMPELPLGLLIGAALWGFGPPTIRDRRLAVLSIVLGLGCTASAGKIGADINYFLPWIPLAALAYAEGGVLLARAQGRRAWLGLPVVVTALAALAFSLTQHALVQATSAVRAWEDFGSPQGRAFRSQFLEVLATGRNPSVRILTDSGHLDIQRGEGTQFGDPWLFHLLADTGRVNLDRVVREIDDERYDFVITTKPLKDPSYASYDFGMPMPMVEAARRHYQYDHKESSLFIYRPRSRTPEVGP
ncbi:MAG: hypothetical protein U0800_01625 [Isosphaeraceae bacterium]